MGALQKLLALKPGLRTTEFWSHLVVSAIALGVGTGLIPDGLSNELSQWVQLGALGAAGVNTGLYAIGRSIAKSGTSSIPSLLQGLLAEVRTGDPSTGLAEAQNVLSELTKAVPSRYQPLIGHVEDDVEARFREIETLVKDIADRVAPIAVGGAPAPADPVPAPVEPPVPTVTGDGTVEPSPGGFPADVATEPVPEVPDEVPAAVPAI